MTLFLVLMPFHCALLPSHLPDTTYKEKEQDSGMTMPAPCAGLGQGFLEENTPATPKAKHLLPRTPCYLKKLTPPSSLSSDLPVISTHTSLKTCPFS